MKKVVLKLFIIILIFGYTNVKANIICNDGTESPSCKDCHQGCCSHHNGCSSQISSSYTNENSYNTKSNNNVNFNISYDNIEKEDNDESESENIKIFCSIIASSIWGYWIGKISNKKHK